MPITLHDLFLLLSAAATAAEEHARAVSNTNVSDIFDGYAHILHSVANVARENS